jgi:hypothetical protein
MNSMSRVLTTTNRGRDVEVPVQIFWPVEDKAAWSCRWEIQWPGRKRSNAARGTDAIQALINALQMIGSELYCSEEHKSGRLFWGKKWTGYGFPVPNNIRDLLVGDDKRSL